MRPSTVPLLPCPPPTFACALFGGLLGVLLLGAGMAFCVRAGAAEKKPQEPYALVVGSVFTEEGFALPGVEVEIRRPGERKPKWRLTSDRRGEFAVRLPAERGTYEISTQSKNHSNQTRTVEIRGEERLSVVFRLPAKSAGKGQER